MTGPRQQIGKSGRTDSRPKDRPYPLRGAAASFGVVWAIELVLARITSRPQSGADVIVSAVVLIALPLALLAVLRAAPRLAGVRASLAGLVGHVPLIIVAGGIAGPIAQRYGGVLSASVVGLALAVLLVAGMRAARLQTRVAPTPATIAVILIIAPVVAWLHQPSGLPPWPQLLAFVVLAALVSLAATAHRLGIVAVVGGALVVAFFPERPGPIAWSQAQTAAAGPDIILVSVDTLRQDDAKAMAAYTKLAEVGVEFTAAQAPSSWTLPSLATAHTGVAIPAHGAQRAGPTQLTPMRADVPTLAERLARHGYDTAAVVAPNPMAGPAFGFDRGFAVQRQFIRDNRHALPRWLESNRPATEIDWELAARPVVADLFTLFGWVPPLPFGNAREVVDAAERILDARRDRPLFLWVHLLDPHLPYRQVHTTRLAPALQRALATASRAKILAEPGWRTPAAIAALREAYRNEIRHVDRELLRLWERLEDDTDRARVVVLTSDHGEEFFEHDAFEHGHSFYQEVIGVPLVVAGLSGRPAGSRDGATVGLIDLAPTLLAAAGIAHELPGQNLASRVAPRVYTTENLMRGRDPLGPYAQRSANWKLIEGFGAMQLFDLDADAGERHNLATEQPSVVADLVLDDRPSVESMADEAEAELSEADKARLRALGYLD